MKRTFLAVFLLLLMVNPLFAAIRPRNIEQDGGEWYFNRSSGSMHTGAILPHTDDTYDLGSATYKFKDIYIDGTGYFDALSIGASTITGNLTLENGEKIINSTDGAVEIQANDDAVELIDLQISSSNTSTSDNDYLRISWYIEDDGSVKTEIAGLDVKADDVTSNSVDSHMTLRLMAADSIADILHFDNTVIYPETDDSVSIGKNTAEFKDAYFDGTLNADAAILDVAEINGAITLANDETLANASDGVIAFTYNDDAVELCDLQIYSSNESTSDNDYMRMSWYAEDDGSVKTEVAQIDVDLDDVTSNSVDSTLEFSVMTGDTLAAELNLIGTALYPETDDDLDLGTSSKEFQDLYLDGTAYMDAVDIDSGAIDGTAVGGSTPAAGSFTTLTTTQQFMLTNSDVALTSPTVTFSADNKCLITLTADANLTGVYPTNGEVGQVIWILSGAGSNTIRFDDGANTVIGSDFTVTEGQGDVLVLMCTDAGGSTWSRVNNDN